MSGAIDFELFPNKKHIFCDFPQGSIKENSLFTVRPYLIFVIFFTRAKFLENKIYTKKTRQLRQNTQKIAKFLRYYGKIHSKLPIFRVKSVKIYTGQKKFTREFSWLS